MEINHKLAGQWPHIFKVGGPYFPIEIIWGKIKSHVKANNSCPNFQRPGIGEHRLGYLEDVIDTVERTVTSHDCIKAAMHSPSFNADAISMNDMPVGR